MKLHSKTHLIVMLLLFLGLYACGPSGENRVVRDQERVLLIKGTERDRHAGLDPGPTPNNHAILLPTHIQNYYPLCREDVSSPTPVRSY